MERWVGGRGGVAVPEILDTNKTFVRPSGKMCCCSWPPKRGFSGPLRGLFEGSAGSPGLCKGPRNFPRVVTLSLWPWGNCWQYWVLQEYEWSWSYKEIDQHPRLTMCNWPQKLSGGGGSRIGGGGRIEVGVGVWIVVKYTPARNYG